MMIARLLPILLTLMLMPCAALRAQQESQFSQYMFNELSINPAYAGYKGELYAHAAYRAQWLGVEGAPRTFQLSADNAAARNMSWGAQLSNDRIGLLSVTSAMGMYSYRIHLPHAIDLALGLSIGGMAATFKAGDLVSIGESTAYRSFTRFALDAAVGVYVNGDVWYAGLSAQRLAASLLGYAYNSDHLLPTYHPQLFLSAGLLLYLGRYAKLKPSLLYSENFYSPSNIDVNAMVLLFSDRLRVGLSYRMALQLRRSSAQPNAPRFEGRTAVFLADIYVTSRLRIGYSYDHSFGRTTTAFSSAHELSMGFYFRKRARQVYSPRFF